MIILKCLAMFLLFVVVLPCVAAWFVFGHEGPVFVTEGIDVPDFVCPPGQCTCRGEALR